MDGALRIHTVPVWRDNLVWLIECLATGEVAAVDGPEYAPIRAYCERHGLRLTTILITHTHRDHTGLLHELSATGELENLRVVGNRARRDDIPGLSQPVSGGGSVQLGAVQGQVLATDGHLDGHLSYVFGDVLFCGDTLFTGGCGYLFDGPAAAMHRSLELLAALDAGTRVCCAHEYTEDNLRFAWMVEPENEALAARIRDVWARRGRGECTVPSTIALERATNPFLRTGSRGLISRVSQGMDDGALSESVDIFAATRLLKNEGRHKVLSDDDLPLL